MSAEIKKEIPLEIAHVLFIDIVGYSKLSINEQNAAVDQLTQIVRATEQFQNAEASERLIKIATGDGMALVFYTGPDAPVRCAIELSRALKNHPEFKLRMGIHSGPVSGVMDVTGRTNLAGAGLNFAQRIMDCGDAGHILLSKHIAEDLTEFQEWGPLLHDLGVCEVKHGVQVTVVNLYDDGVGNPELPRKFKLISQRRARHRWVTGAAALVAIGAIVAGAMLFFGPRRLSAPEKSIAVLPFENLSEDKSNAFFADGVQDEILTHLARIADLKVISRTSVMQYKTGAVRNLREIGKQLGVAHLLEGSVQRAANRIRVNAQLIDARTDSHLWAQTYDRELADVFAIQSELAKAIADQLQAKILPHEQKGIEKQLTKDIAAYDLYVRATDELDAAPNSDQSKPHFLAAIDLLEQAVRRDPTFLNAYCKLAQAHDQLYLFGEDHTPARLALAEQALNTAQSLQPDAPEVHLARAGHLYSKLDYDGARAEIETVRRTLPNEPKAFEWSGYINRRQGRWNESTRDLERAVELDPNNILVLDQISTSYQCLREYSKQVEMQDRIVALRPDNLDARISRAQTELFWKADPQPLHKIIAAAIDRDPGLARNLAANRILLAFAERDVPGGLKALADLGDGTWGPDAIQFPRQAGEGIFNRLKGDSAAAQAGFNAARAVQLKVIKEQVDYGPAWGVMSVIDGGLGRKEDAIREARRALELMPINEDCVNGAHLMAWAAMAYGWVGEKDLAIDQLKRATPIPGAVNYGFLKLFPHWDPLRGDPRFEQIVADLAPK